MAEPTDERLYNETKKHVDGIYDKPSAYRSMAYTRFYLRAFREKYGNDKKAYTGKKPGDLARWRKEKWVDIRSYLDTPSDPKACGNVKNAKGEYPLCMPEKKAETYSKGELNALLNRKAELGKTRLVKEPYLRDLGVGKQTKERQARIGRVLPKRKVRSLSEERENPETKKVRAASEEREAKQEEAKRPRGRPRKEKVEVAEELVKAERKKIGRPRTRVPGVVKSAEEKAEDRAKRNAERKAAEAPKFIVHRPPPGETGFMMRFD
jgi:hypothetical protein